MELGELIEKLIMARKELPYGIFRVRMRAQNSDEFVWLEAELVGVESRTDAPDVVLVARVTPEQETAIFTRLGPEEDPLEVESPGVADTGWVEVEL